MGAFTNLWNSEKGLAGGALIVAATVLVALGRLGAEQWLEYTKWIFGIFATNHTVQTVLTNRSAAPPPVTGIVTGEITVKDAPKGPS